MTGADLQTISPMSSPCTAISPGRSRTGPFAEYPGAPEGGARDLHRRDQPHDRRRQGRDRCRAVEGAPLLGPLRNGSPHHGARFPGLGRPASGTGRSPRPRDVLPALVGAGGRGSAFPAPSRKSWRPTSPRWRPSSPWRVSRALQSSDGSILPPRPRSPRHAVCSSSSAPSVARVASPPTAGAWRGWRWLRGWPTWSYGAASWETEQRPACWPPCSRAMSSGARTVSPIRTSEPESTCFGVSCRVPMRTGRPCDGSSGRSRRAAAQAPQDRGAGTRARSAAGAGVPRSGGPAPARRRERYLLRNGLGARVRPQALGAQEYLVAAELDGRLPESEILLGARIFAR